MFKDLRPKEQALAEYISELSEQAYNAEWMKGVEFALWNAVLGKQAAFGRLLITDEILKRLKALSADCGGWFYFDESTVESFLQLREWERKFRDEKASLSQS